MTTNEGERPVTHRFLEECMRHLEQEISAIKSAVIDTENSFIAGDRTVLDRVAEVSKKQDYTNNRLNGLEKWQIEHDGIEKGRQQVSTGIRNWIILGFGATATLQILFGLGAYLVAVK